MNSPLRIEITPQTMWAARLKLGDGKLGLVSPPQESLQPALTSLAELLKYPARAGEGLPARSSSQRDWSNLEDLLWNGLLPLQKASGRFDAGPFSHEEGLAALEAFLSCSAALEGSALQIHLPVSSTLEFQTEERPATWRMESSYPEQGFASLTYYGEEELEMPLALRVPAFAEGVQLVRNGSACPLNGDQGFLHVSGPWRFGDNVQLRFGIPFSLVGATRKPLLRSYPGAATVEGAELFHGARLLAPAPGANGSGDGDPEFGIGVRKDGVLLLKPDGDSHGSPFEEHGDFFLSKDAEPRLLVSKALWASLYSEPYKPVQTRIHFAPYETAFDHGA